MTDNSKIKLVIVDCQNDFCEGGALAVLGANKAIDNIIEFVRENKKRISSIHLTLDWHPATHCSFAENGGQWPKHCVMYTEGALPKKKLLTALEELSLTEDDGRYYSMYFHEKGKNIMKEEYGAFDLSDDTDDCLADMQVADTVVVAGIAGDFCVLETAKNLLKRGMNVKFLMKGIASIDGGEKLNKFIDSLAIEYRI